MFKFTKRKPRKLSGKKTEDLKKQDTDNSLRKALKFNSLYDTLSQ
jgi:hypothetical protein